jgi:hypothetical protein
MKRLPCPRKGGLAVLAQGDVTGPAPSQVADVCQCYPHPLKENLTEKLEGGVSVMPATQSAAHWQRKPTPVQGYESADTSADSSDPDESMGCQSTSTASGAGDAGLSPGERVRRAASAPAKSGGTTPPIRSRHVLAWRHHKSQAGGGRHSSATLRSYTPHGAASSSKLVGQGLGGPPSPERHRKVQGSRFKIRFKVQGSRFEIRKRALGKGGEHARTVQGSRFKITVESQ